MSSSLLATGQVPNVLSRIQFGVAAVLPDQPAGWEIDFCRKGAPPFHHAPTESRLQGLRTPIDGEDAGNTWDLRRHCTRALEGTHQ